MKTIETTVYRCDFCAKCLRRKHAMIKHEFDCGKNPKNRSACSGCVFLIEGETEVYYHDRDEKTIPQKTFRCKKLNKDLYPFKVVRKGLLEKYPETFEGMEQMPTSCEHWNYTKT